MTDSTEKPHKVFKSLESSTVSESGEICPGSPDSSIGRSLHQQFEELWLGNHKECSPECKSGEVETYPGSLDTSTAKPNHLTKSVAENIPGSPDSSTSMPLGEWVIKTTKGLSGSTVAGVSLPHSTSDSVETQIIPGSPDSSIGRRVCQWVEEDTVTGTEDPLDPSIEDETGNTSISSGSGPTSIGGYSSEGSYDFCSPGTAYFTKGSPISSVGGICSSTRGLTLSDKPDDATGHGQQNSEKLSSAPQPGSPDSDVALCRHFGVEGVADPTLRYSESEPSDASEEELEMNYPYDLDAKEFAAFWTTDPNPISEFTLTHNEDKGERSEDEVMREIQASEASLELEIHSLGDKYAKENLVLELMDANAFSHFHTDKESWSVQLMNAASFCSGDMIQTFTFIHCEPDIVSIYTKFFEELNTFYSKMEERHIGFLPLERAVENTIAVVKLDGLGFVRVQIIKHSCSFYDHRPIAVPVVLIDYSSRKYVLAKDLMYATTMCIQLPSQANELYPDLVSPYQDTWEILTVVSKFIQKNGVHYTAKLVQMNKAGVAIVELFHPNFPEGISSHLKTEIIKTFPGEISLEAGMVMDEVTVSFAEKDAHVYVKMPTYVLRLLNHELACIKLDDYETSKKERSSELILNDIYIVAKEGKLFRVLLVDLPEDYEEKMVMIYFIDNGLRCLIPHKDLVKADYMNAYIKYFPSQAIRVRLCNLVRIPVQNFLQLTQGDELTLMVFESGTNSTPALVDFKSKLHLDESRACFLSETVIRKYPSAVKQWDRPILHYAEPVIQFHSILRVDMRGTPWGDALGNPVDLAEGVELDVYIVQDHMPSNDKTFYVQPYGQQEVLQQMELTLSKWVKLLDVEPTHTALQDTLYCSLYIRDLTSFVRVRLTENPLQVFSDYDDTIKILILDYGLHTIVQKKHLRYLSLQAASTLPCMGARGSGTVSRLLNTSSRSRRGSGSESKTYDGDRFLFKVAKFHYDEHECLHLEGDLKPHNP